MNKNEITEAARATVIDLMRGDLGAERTAPCRLDAVMNPDGSRWIRIEVPDRGETRAFDDEFADVLASWLESPDADWKDWTPYAQSWARDLRGAIAAVRSVGAN